jgi:hypothetical protein
MRGQFRETLNNPLLAQPSDYRAACFVQKSCQNAAMARFLALQSIPIFSGCVQKGLCRASLDNLALDFCLSSAFSCQCLMPAIDKKSRSIERLF